MPEWTSYKAVIPKSSNDPVSGRLLEEVHHTVHTPVARRIIEDGAIRAGLIYDKSNLNTTRISVTWFSANRWAYGSIYGGVQFSVKWSDVIKNKTFYWVEAMETYSPTAYRILVSDRDLSDMAGVSPYNPTKDKGPLREKNGRWYYNGDYTSEFMFDCDFPLKHVHRLEFIKHHETICKNFKASCSERRMLPEKFAARILAHILGNDIHSVDHALKENTISGFGQLSADFERGIDGLLKAYSQKKVGFKGNLTARSSRIPVVRGMLSLFATGNQQRAAELVSLLESEDIFERAIEDIVNEHFSLSGWQIPE